MDIGKKGESEDNTSNDCTHIAKQLLSVGHVQDAETLLVIALKVSRDEQAQALLDQIQAKEMITNPNKPTETEDETKRQGRCEIEARNELEEAQYVEMNTGRFKMRAEFLSLQVAVFLKGYENKTGNRAPSTSVPIGDKIENLLMKVHDAITNADLGKAEKHLVEAERIYDEACAEIPNSKKTKAAFREIYIPVPRERAALTGCDEIRYCIQIAQAAIKDKDYDKAESFLLGAERIRPTEVTESDNSSQNKNIESPSNESAKDSDTAHEHNHKLAEKIIKLAKSSIDEEKFERAKKCLEKAELLHPTIEAKNLLHRIVEIESLKKTLDKATKYLMLAHRAEDKGDLDLSEKYLLEAQEICPSIDTKEDLLRITNDRVKKITTEKPMKPKTPEEPEAFVNAVETYISDAKAEMALGNYDVAETLILELKANIPNADVDGILSEIRAARASRSSSGVNINDFRTPGANPGDGSKQSSSNDPTKYARTPTPNSNAYRDDTPGKNEAKSNVEDDKPSTSREKSNEKVKNLIDMALVYIDRKELHQALLFAELANNLSPSDCNANLVEQIKAAIKQEEVNTLAKKEKKKVNHTKAELDMYIDFATIELLPGGDIAKAEAILMAASTLHPSKRVDELLKTVRRRKGGNDCTADDYLIMAKNSVKIENFVLAEHFLTKAYSLSPAHHIKVSIDKVVDSKKRVFDSKKPIWKKNGSYFSY